MKERGDKERERGQGMPLMLNYVIILNMICGQSYKQFMLVIYESRVVIWGIFKSGTTLES